MKLSGDLHDDDTLRTDDGGATGWPSNLRTKFFSGIPQHCVFEFLLQHEIYSFDVARRTSAKILQYL